MFHKGIGTCFKKGKFNIYHYLKIGGNIISSKRRILFIKNFFFSTEKDCAHNFYNKKCRKCFVNALEFVYNRLSVII